MNLVGRIACLLRLYTCCFRRVVPNFFRLGRLVELENKKFGWPEKAVRCMVIPLLNTVSLTSTDMPPGRLKAEKPSSGSELIKATLINRQVKVRGKKVNQPFIVNIVITKFCHSSDYFESCELISAGSCSKVL